MPTGALLRNALRFTRLLRDLGARVDPQRARLFARALGCIPIANRAEFYHAARCCLIYREQDLDLFDAAFQAFWRVPATRGMRLRVPGPTRKRISNRPFSPPAERASEAPAQTDLLLLQADRSYSPLERLRARDFSELSSEESEAILQLIRNMGWQLAERRSRRRAAGDGRLLDHRRTLRLSMRRGGEVLTWIRRSAKRKPRPLVLIADVSGSMERYSRLLLHFLYGMSHGLDRRVEAFLYSTRLTRITHQLRGKVVEHALAEVSRQVPDWSGGTRIGSALRIFNRTWAGRVRAGGAIVMVISDGLDRGEADLLAAEVARLQRTCHRLIWLNPLLGSADYRPLARGMRQALPFLDDFLPAHSFDSLAKLADYLRLSADSKPFRRQQIGRSTAYVTASR